jgi:hypothetical protein
MVSIEGWTNPLRSWFNTKKRVLRWSAFLVLALVALILCLHWSWFIGAKSRVEVVVYFVSTLAAGFAVWTYWSNERTRRAEWLFTLYQRFFEEDHFKPMRRKLDYTSDPTFTELRSCIATPASNPVLEEELVDYLNFFEFVAGLQRSGQLTLDEVAGLFKYYLKILTCDDLKFIREYIREQDFEQLSALLDKMEKEGRFRTPKA